MKARLVSSRENPINLREPEWKKWENSTARGREASDENFSVKFEGKAAKGAVGLIPEKIKVSQSKRRN